VRGGISIVVHTRKGGGGARAGAIIYLPNRI
jgi:hypothetical protein